MSNTKKQQNVILCGFMGCGKSTVGLLLARRMKLRFLDLDYYIEEQAGMSIAEIFEKQGEEAFRKLEHQAVLGLAQRQGYVVPTGGGVLTREENIAPLKESGLVVYINTPFALCYQRIASTDRPLIKTRTREELYELYLARRKHYREASDLEVSGIRGSRAVVRSILQKLQEDKSNEQKGACPAGSAPIKTGV